MLDGCLVRLTGSFSSRPDRTHQMRADASISNFPVSTQIRSAPETGHTSTQSNRNRQRMEIL
jgi:hypothetical protein